MKRFVFAAMVVMIFWTQAAWAHQIYIKKNPTNEGGIEFGVDNASNFVRWRAYVRGVSNNSQGQNTGWHDSGNGWWYYDLSYVTQRVMWRLDGIANQEFVITYWVFRSDGTWDYGPQVTVVSDQILPTAAFTNIYSGQVFTQSQFTIQVSSSDNLSGVEALRIYAVIPSGYNLSDWIPSGLPNQYYKEFAGISANYSFTAPAAGTYTFTLWVKDKAGNIAYEPGGPIMVTVNLQPNPPPDPQPVVPAAPSNLVLTQNGQNIVLTWQDNSSNEDGFLLYRNWTYLATLPANASNYTDSGLNPSQYCYRLNSFKGSLNSSVVEACLTIDPPVSDPHYADSFTYPLNCDKIYRLETDSKIPVGACYDYQPFGSLFAFSSKIHQGADLNLKGVNDLGAPVYAIANALIWDFGWTSGWGNYLILCIQAKLGQDFTLSDGSGVTEIHVLYGHLNEIKVIKPDGQTISQSQLTKQQTYVQKGWQIGTVGDGNGNFSPHLHLEIRINGYSQLGAGYWPVDDLAYLDYFVDPIEFIENNWDLVNGNQLSLYIHGYDRDVSRLADVEFDPDCWQRQGRLYDGLPLSSVGWANHIWLKNAGDDCPASWNFYVPQSGAWSVYAIIPRYYAEADFVTYKIWHSRQGLTNPYEVTINQSNDNENKKVYLGTFDFYNDWRYSVEIAASQSALSTDNVVLDTLVLIYEGDFGAGGGSLPEPPPLPEPEPDPDPDPPPPNLEDAVTIYSDGSLTFEYQGSYNYPELHCTGAGLDWTNAILANGLKNKTVALAYSDTIYCNIVFEDNNWLASWLGILPGQLLLAQGQAITANIDNGQGGRNLIFHLVLNEIDDNPPDPPADNPADNPGTTPGIGGCQIKSGEPALESWFNFLVMLLPLILIYGSKKFAKSN